MKTSLALLAALWVSPAFSEMEAVALPADGKVRIELTAVTLGDDCGPVKDPPALAPGGAPAGGSAKMRRRSDAADAIERRQCEQTSMQLAVTAGKAKGPFALHVKKVELFDDAGASIGELTPRTPTVWSPDTSVYRPWDEHVAPGATLKVSYALSQPKWSEVANRRGKTYVLKAVFAVGNEEQKVEREVKVNAAPTSFPPNVRT